MRIKSKKLEHEGDVSVCGAQILHRLAVDQDVAAVDLLESGDGAQGRGFAAARRTKQNHEFAVVNLQVKLANDVVVPEVLLDVSQIDVRHGRSVNACRAAARSGRKS